MSQVSPSCNVRQAKEYKAQLDSWGEFQCKQTGGWMPLEQHRMAFKEDYWCSLGVAARYQATIRLDPAFGDSELPAFTDGELRKECMHVR